MIVAIKAAGRVVVRICAKITRAQVPRMVRVVAVEAHWPEASTRDPIATVNVAAPVRNVAVANAVVLIETASAGHVMETMVVAVVDLARDQ